MTQSLVNAPQDPQLPVPIPVKRAPVKLASRQVRHLAQAVQLEETGTAPLIRFTMLLVSVACLAFTVWAAMTHLEEIAAAEGQIVPQGSVVTVQHFEGGLIDEILVKEGQLVEANQPLVKMSAAAALGDLEQTRAREAALLIKAERIRAFVEDRKPDFSFTGPGYEKLIADNMAIYQSQARAARTAQAVVQAQVEQKRADVTLLEQQMHTLQDQVDAMSEELALREDLVAQHLVTRVQYLDTKREQARMRGDLARTVGQAVSARESLTEVRNRLLDQTSTLRKQSMDDLGTVIGELAQVQESIGRLEDRVNRLAVVSPARGYVKGLSVHNIAAVIQPGGLVCEIVPSDRNLTVDAKVTTRDVGHLRPGQRVKVKVGTYDFARYGAVMGTLQRVSASTFLDEKGNPYFKASIAIDNPYVGEVPGRYPITPGMTVTAEIITGDKTLLQYMLKPIFTQLRQSFHER
jgi:HlyD family type I secretion membrane fusion protein